MTKKTDKILDEVLNEIKPSSGEMKEIEKKAKDFTNELKTEIKKQKIDAEVFIGGSFAKGTLIKKKKYDIDVFIRFNKSYGDSEISKITKKTLQNIRKIQKVHGSREYYRISEKDNLIFEVVPVIKVQRPEQAKNTTDLSYFHVRYLKDKLKEDKIKKEIMIAKAFCNSNKCYGAESHIKGFSGYSLELLVYYYGNFEKFLRQIIKINPNEKKIIDIEKHYKTKKEALMNLNTSKLESPIILIDPTYKQRNALAALSKKTFEYFQEISKKFLKNPSEEYFKHKKIDLEKIKTLAKKSKKEFIAIKTKTSKQEGAIAGSKLLKFYSLISEEIKKYFEIYDKGFEYNERKTAINYFVVKPRKEIIIKGPFVNDDKNVQRFLKKHKNAYKKNNRYYAKEKINNNPESFLKRWKKENKETIKDMSITELEIVY